MAFISGTRVLDLTDERGLMTGRILADLGADVVHVEAPNGSPARSAQPTAAGREASFLWEAYAANKRSVALDLAVPGDAARMRALIEAADILIESSGPVAMRREGLDWSDVRQINPRLIYVSMTGFGRTGPKAGYAESDLILWAAGGPLEPHRDGSRPPVRPSIPQAHRLAAADAAAGALLALIARRTTGRGQLVDVAVQAALGSATLATVLAAAVGDVPRAIGAGQELTHRVDRSGSGSGTPAASKKWECVDGMIEFHVGIGPAAGAFTGNFFQWMLAEGEPVQKYTELDWRTVDKLIESGEFPDAEIDRVRATVRDFLATKTKDQVLRAAVQYKLLCVPIFTTADLAATEQLEARHTFVPVGDGERTLRLVGMPAAVNVDAFTLTRRAPKIGEHTDSAIRDWSTAPSGAQEEAVLA
ncbi:CoA transferase [Rhodococcus sp. 3A]|nr:CoA transferase [Rhodococcus sp. 3A]MBC2644590.1 CoA transferase [Rhodococcus sp. 3A]MBC2890966.1 CoA transferase [Rhodococcus sp. 4CII]MBC2897689.1 CoA transferase [Rhodococcus sp. 4CII]